MWEGQWIPIVFFFLFLLPPVAVGFFKGWKTALFVAGVTFALTGILVGIGLATYDKLIWPIFKSLFVKSVVDSHMAINSLKEVSKPTAIAIAAGIFVLPNYLIAFGLYWPLRARLENHLWPKTSDIDQNTKNISYRKHLASRLSGLSISLTSSLVMASMATTASAAFFSRSDSKHRSLSDFTGSLSMIYTVGQGGYDGSFFELREFLDKDFKNKQMEEFKNLMYIPQDGSINVNAITNLNAEPFKSQLAKLLKNERTSEALTNLVIDSAHFAPITLLDNDYGGATPTNFNDAITTNNIESTIAAIHLNLHISSDVKAKMESIISNKVIKSFEESGYAKELADVEKAIATIKGQIAERTKDSQTARSAVDAISSEIAALNKSIPLLQKRIQDLGDDSTGLIGAQKAVYDSAHSITLQKETDYNAHEPRLTTARAAVGSAQNSVDDVNKRIDDKKIDIQSKKDEISRLNASIASKTQIAATKGNEISKKNNELTALQNSQTSLNTQIRTENAKPTPDSTVINNLNNQLRTVADQITTVESEIRDLNTEMSNANQDKATLESTLQQANAYLATLESDLVTLQTELTRAQTALKAAQTILDPIQAESDRLKQVWDKAAATEQAENGKYGSLKSEKDEAEKKLTNDTASLASKRVDIIAKINEWKTLNNKNAITGPTDVFKEGTTNTGAPLAGSIKEKEEELKVRQEDPAHGEKFLKQQKQDKYKEWLEIKAKYLHLIDKLLSV